MCVSKTVRFQILFKDCTFTNLTGNKTKNIKEFYKIRQQANIYFRTKQVGLVGSQGYQLFVQTTPSSKKEPLSQYHIVEIKNYIDMNTVHATVMVDVIEDCVWHPWQADEISIIPVRYYRETKEYLAEDYDPSAERKRKQVEFEVPTLKKTKKETSVDFQQVNNIKECKESIVKLQTSINESTNKLIATIKEVCKNLDEITNKLDATIKTLNGNFDILFQVLLDKSIALNLNQNHSNLQRS